MARSATDTGGPMTLEEIRFTKALVDWAREIHKVEAKHAAVISRWHRMAGRRTAGAPSRQVGTGCKVRCCLALTRCGVKLRLDLAVANECDGNHEQRCANDPQPEEPTPPVHYFNLLTCQE